MRILITGATGFLGYHIANACVRRGHAVHLLRRSTSKTPAIPDAKWLIQDQDGRWKEDVNEFAPEVLIHAAWGGVAATGRNDHSVQTANVEMTRALYNLFPFKQIIALGSQDEYGEYSDCIDETHPLSPISEYAKAKIQCCEDLQELARQSNIEWQWIRVFSMYGERQQDNWLIPSIIRKCLDGADSVQTTPGEQVYSYLYAGDFGEAIASIVGQTGKSGIYNIASSHPMRLCDLFEFVKQSCGSNIIIDKSLPYRAHQTMKMLGDCTKFREAFGEFEHTTLQQGLAKVIKYMRDNNG